MTCPTGLSRAFHLIGHVMSGGDCFYGDFNLRLLVKNSSREALRYLVSGVVKQGSLSYGQPG